MPTIRPATDADGDAIAALIASVFAEYEGCPFVRAEFPELDAPASHFARKGGGLWLLDDAGRVVGSTGLTRIDEVTFELHKVYLAADRRGGGFAAKLVDVAVAAARAAGGRRLRLWTDTRFASGHRFYDKRGFTRLPVVRYLADASKAWEYAYVADLAGPSP